MPKLLTKTVDEISNPSEIMIHIKTSTQTNGSRMFRIHESVALIFPVSPKLKVTHVKAFLLKGNAGNP